MSQEQANTFRKYRTADDVPGNLVWAARLGQKALRVGREAASRIDVERELELSDEEKMVWRLLKLARRYMDLETSGILPVEKMRGLLRGFVAAEMVDIVDVKEAKALIPAEVKRVRAEVQGKELARPREPLRGRVYRPDIDGNGAGATGTTGATVTSATSADGAPPSDGAPASHPAAAQTMRSPPGSSAGMAMPPNTDPRVIAGMNDEERLFRDDILRAFAAMSKQNHYEFMGVPKNAPDAVVRGAYMRLAREYHPDRVAGGGLGADEGLRSKIDALFKRLGDAHQHIGTADARAAYNREVEALGSGGAQAADGKRQRRPIEAQNAFKMAEIFFKKKDFKQAEAHYRQALMFDGEDPKLLTGLAFCIWLNPDHDEKTRTEEARKRLTEVLQKYKHGDAAYKLGLMMRKANDEAGAQRQFAIANRLDTHHVDAQREVRLASMRQQKAEQERKDSSTLLGKLLKK